MDSDFAALPVRPTGLGSGPSREEMPTDCSTGELHLNGTYKAGVATSPVMCLNLGLQDARAPRARQSLFVPAVLRISLPPDCAKTKWLNSRP